MLSYSTHTEDPNFAEKKVVLPKFAGISSVRGALGRGEVVAGVSCREPWPRSLEVESMTSLRVPGALSGPLAGTSFIAGVAGAVALSDSPYPRPGAQPADIRRYFRGSPAAARVSVIGQLVSAGFSDTVHRLGGEAGRSVGMRLARAAHGDGRWRHASLHVAGDFGAVRGGAHW